MSNRCDDPINFQVKMYVYSTGMLVGIILLLLFIPILCSACFIRTVYLMHCFFHLRLQPLCPVSLLYGLSTAPMSSPTRRVKEPQTRKRYWPFLFTTVV